MSERKPNVKRRQFGFIESLSVRVPEDLRSAEASQYLKNFTKKKFKEELLQKLFHIFNKSIFDNKLPSDLKLQWNNRLTATAGLCKYKSVGGKPTAEIHISTKVCDIPERLRDTCVHEMCHAACYLINGLTNEGHGRVWQSWARKVGDVYVDIPKVSTCHNYAINKKYTYKCKDCGEEIHRFQKSINIDKMVCGRCHGRFDLYCNNVKLTYDPIEFQVAQFQTPQNKKVNKFAQFVKENYGSVKSEKKLAHKDVMLELSKKFKQLNYQ
jgi:predicted SprT family Zn-dependent metalloprotease